MEKHLIKFEELKVGQKIWIKAEVEQFTDSSNYPIRVLGHGFTRDGKLRLSDKDPMLFLSNPFEGSERVVEVRDSYKHKWERRVFIKTSCGITFCWLDAETIEESANVTETEGWYFMRELPAKTVLTKQQIADKFGVEVENLEIEL
jgi:hypothetical protein